MKYFVIGDEDTVIGFGLAGVKGRIARNPDEAAEAFDSALANRDVGIVIITERVAELIRPRVDRYVFAEQFPLIVEIPDREGKIAGHMSLREMVNASIGISV